MKSTTEDLVGRPLPVTAMPTPFALPVAGAAHRWPLAALSLSMLLSSLGTSGANVGLPAMALAFGATFEQVQWIVLAYLLAVTTLIVGAGRLGDLFGRKRLLLAGTALFTVASALCGAAPSLAWLVAARAAQGLGAAFMMALTMALVGTAIPRSTTARAMGLLATMSAFGTALGPSLGGLLLAGFGWRAIFLVHLPLGAVSLAMVYRHVGADRAEERPVAPPSNDAAGAPFDVVGTLLLALALGAYALAMTVRPASARGGFGSINLVLLALAAVGAVLFAMVEARARAPLVRLALFRDAALRASLAMSMLVATVMMATLVVGPFYLARTLGLDAAGTGLVLAAGPLAAALAGVPAGRLAERRGHHLATMAGLLGIAAGAFAVAAMPTALGIPGYVLPLVVITVGYALFQTANNTAVMTAVPTDQRGVVAGLLSLSRNLGLVTGASAMGALFAAASSAAGAVGTPQGTAVGMRITFAVAGLLALMAVGLALAGRGQGRGLQHRVAAPVSLGARDP